MLASCSRQISLPAPMPKCEIDLCVNRAHAMILNDSLVIQFELTDFNGKADKGSIHKFEELQSMGIFLLKGGKETYLIGGEYNANEFFCFEGNDTAWLKVQYATICEISFRMNRLAAKVAGGDIVRIENLNYDFKHTTSIA